MLSTLLCSSWDGGGQSDNFTRRSSILNSLPYTLPVTAAMFGGTY